MPRSTQSIRASIFIEYDLPDRVPPEKITEYMDRIELGDENAKIKLIEAHLRLGVSIAAQYSIDFPNLTNDIVSIAWLTIVQKVNGLSDKDSRIKSITAYLDRCIRYRIADFIDSQYPVKMTRQSFSSMQDFVDARVAIGFTVYDQCESDIGQEQENFNHLEDILGIVVETPFEMLFVKYKKQGMTDQQVADEIGVSKKTVQRTRKVLQKKYKDLV